jgi:hypothetical protein
MAYVQRTGQDTILRSNQTPAIAIQVDPEFKYVGSTSFILYDVARAEQHHFVIADAERRVLRRLWFQFEGFLENNNHTYDYSGMDTLILNGFTFLHNAYPMNVEEVYQARPTSDSAHAVDFFREKGYRLTGDILSHRMVWLDEERRNELMIIYSEILGSTGYRASDLVEGGVATAEWPAFVQGLQQRSLFSFKIL